MFLTADRIAVAGRVGNLVPPTSLAVGPHEVVFVECDQDRATPFGLALTGRLALSDGVLTYEPDGDVDLADASALIDAPGISSPEGSIDVPDAVAEELAIAGRPSGRKAVRAWLRHHDLDHLDGQPIEAVSGPDRVRLLCALAVSRPRIRLLVLDTPDRHDGDLRDWQLLAQSYAEKGYAVVVICDDRSTRLLGVDAYRVGRTAELSRSDS